MLTLMMMMRKVLLVMIFFLSVWAVFNMKTITDKNLEIKMVKTKNCQCVKG